MYASDITLILVLQIYEMHCSITIPKFYNQKQAKGTIKVILIEMYVKTLHSKMKAERYLIVFWLKTPFLT